MKIRNLFNLHHQRQITKKKDLFLSFRKLKNSTAPMALTFDIKKMDFILISFFSYFSLVNATLIVISIVYSSKYKMYHKILIHQSSNIDYCNND